MEASDSSEMLEQIYQTALRHISEENYLSGFNIHRRKDKAFPVTDRGSP
jgi:hypothetical protein